MEKCPAKMVGLTQGWAASSATGLAECFIWPNTLINPGTLAHAKHYVSLILEPDLGILLGFWMALQCHSPKYS